MNKRSFLLFFIVFTLLLSSGAFSATVLPGYTFNPTLKFSEYVKIKSMMLYEQNNASVKYPVSVASSWTDNGAYYYRLKKDTPGFLMPNTAYVLNFTASDLAGNVITPSVTYSTPKLDLKINVTQPRYGGVTSNTFTLKFNTTFYAKACVYTEGEVSGMNQGIFDHQTKFSSNDNVSFSGQLSFTGNSGTYYIYCEDIFDTKIFGPFKETFYKINSQYTVNFTAVPSHIFSGNKLYLAFSSDQDVLCRYSFNSSNYNDMIPINAHFAKSGHVSVPITDSSENPFTVRMQCVNKANSKSKLFQKQINVVYNPALSVIFPSSSCSQLKSKAKVIVETSNPSILCNLEINNTNYSMASVPDTGNYWDLTSLSDQLSAGDNKGKVTCDFNGNQRTQNVIVKVLDDSQFNQLLQNISKPVCGGIVTVHFKPLKLSSFKYEIRYTANPHDSETGDITNDTTYGYFYATSSVYTANPHLKLKSLVNDSCFLTYRLDVKVCSLNGEGQVVSTEYHTPWESKALSDDYFRSCSKDVWPPKMNVSVPSVFEEGKYITYKLTDKTTYSGSYEPVKNMNNYSVSICVDTSKSDQVNTDYDCNDVYYQLPVTNGKISYEDLLNNNVFSFDDSGTYTLYFKYKVADSNGNVRNGNFSVSVYYESPLAGNEEKLLPDWWCKKYFKSTNPSVCNASADPDNDNLTNYEEYLFGTNPLKSDTDGDGYSDYYEITHHMNPLDPTNNNLDANNDGIPDWWEEKFFNTTNIDVNADPDHDGLTNLEEYEFGTDPLVSDTDHDGTNDYKEIIHGTNPLDPTNKNTSNTEDLPDWWCQMYFNSTSPSKCNATADPDHDGLTNYEEYKFGTDPLVNDTDRDGISDGAEIDHGTNPLDPTNNQVDFNGDGIPDWWEDQFFNTTDIDVNADPDHDGLTNLEEYEFGTNPLISDTDGDGVNDGTEIKSGSNPLDPMNDNNDSNNDGIPDWWEIHFFNTTNINVSADPDHDGLTNLQEYKHGTDPLIADTDGDGVNDGTEIEKGTDPLDPNSYPTTPAPTENNTSSNETTYVSTPTETHNNSWMMWLGILVMILGVVGLSYMFYAKSKHSKSKSSNSNNAPLMMPSSPGPSQSMMMPNQMEIPQQNIVPSQQLESPDEYEADNVKNPFDKLNEHIKNDEMREEFNSKMTDKQIKTYVDLFFPNGEFQKKSPEEIEHSLDSFVDLGLIERDKAKKIMEYLITNQPIKNEFDELKKQVDTSKETLEKIKTKMKEKDEEKRKEELKEIIQSKTVEPIPETDKSEVKEKNSEKKENKPNAENSNNSLDKNKSNDELQNKDFSDVSSVEVNHVKENASHVAQNEEKVDYDTSTSSAVKSKENDVSLINHDKESDENNVPNQNKKENKEFTE